MQTVITKKKKEKLLKGELKRMVNIIIRKYFPEKIILFGSLVKGRVNEGSDIDLLIIKNTPRRAIERSIELARLTRPKVGIDFFVYTPSELNYFIKEKYSFILEVLEEGKILYEKRERRLV